MKYCEVTVRTTSQSAELVAYFLQEVCMDGVSIYDRNDLYQNASWDYKEDTAEAAYQEEVLVKGYCEKEDTQRVLSFLYGKFADLQDAGSLQISVAEVEGDAWVAKWKETFRPIETQKLVVCPEWQSVQTDKQVLLLDTGVAFGTGQHETTSMCLSFAEQLDLQGKKVLDVGCGSGILGLAALLLGAQSAHLVDIDTQAVEAATHNAVINGLQHRCTICADNLIANTEGVFDVVFANLTADVLALLKPQLPKVVHSNTAVVVSGILDTKLQGVLQLFSDAFEPQQIAQKGEWCAALLKLR